MNNYTRKTLMRNERIIYSAKSHFFNYFTSVLAIIIGLLLTGIFEPSVPDGLKDYEAVQGVTKKVDKSMDEIQHNVDRVGRTVKDFFKGVVDGMPKEIQGYIKMLYNIRTTYFGLVFLFLGFVNFIRVYIKSKTNEYCVTNKRIIFKYGFLTTDTSEVNLDRVEGVKVQQSLTDKIVGRGDVLVNGVGNEHVDMRKISDPTTLRKAILEAVSRYGSATR